MPTAHKFGMLVDDEGLSHKDELQLAAGSAGVDIVLQAAKNISDYGPAFDAFRSAGVEGIVTNTDKVYRLIVSVNLLGRSVAVEIDRDWVRPNRSRIGPQSLIAAESVRYTNHAG